jgi:protein TonB
MRIFLVVWILVAGATTWRLRDAMWAYLVGSTPPSAEAAATDSPTEETKAVTRRRAKAKESLVPQPRESASSQHAPATPANPSRAGFAATPSRLLLRVEPTYPASARALHISSTVVLEAQILKDGSVGNIKFVSGDTAFREAALDAVRQWKYQPATLDGVPMQSTAVIDLQFSP